MVEALLIRGTKNSAIGNPPIPDVLSGELPSFAAREIPSDKTTDVQSLNPRDMSSLGSLGSINIASEYTSNCARIISYTMKFGVTREDAEDVYQDSWMKAINKLSKYDPSAGDFTNWLATIVKNTCIDLIRKNSKKATIPLVTENWNFDEFLADTSNLIDEEVVDKLEGEWLISKIREIPDTQATSIFEYYYNSKRQREIAEELTVPLGTIKTRISRGISNVRKNLRNEGLNSLSDVSNPVIYGEGGSEDGVRR